MKQRVMKHVLKKQQQQRNRVSLKGKEAVLKLIVKETKRGPDKEVEKLVPVGVHVFKLRERTCGTEKRIWKKKKKRCHFLENNTHNLRGCITKKKQCFPI
jgi:hypothetical protein